MTCVVRNRCQSGTRRVHQSRKWARTQHTGPAYTACTAQMYAQLICQPRSLCVYAWRAKKAWEHVLRVPCSGVVARASRWQQAASLCVLYIALTDGVSMCDCMQVQPSCVLLTTHRRSFEVGVYTCARCSCAVAMRRQQLMSVWLYTGARLHHHVGARKYQTA